MNRRRRHAPSVGSGTTSAASLGRLPRTTLAGFLRGGVRVTASCDAGVRATLRLEVSSSQGRKLGLRGKLVASRAVNSRDSGVKTRLTAPAKVKRALRATRRSVTTTVSLRSGTDRDSRRLVLRR